MKHRVEGPKLRIGTKDLKEIGKVYPNSVVDEMAVPSYIHWNPLIRWLMWKRLAVVQELCRGLRINTGVDFGTGTGVMLSFLAEISKHVIAIDKCIAPATRLCKRYKLQNIELYETGILPLPLSDGTADLVLCLDVLEHIGALRDVTQELARILKAGGVLIVSGPSENLIYKLGRFIAGFRKRAIYHRWNVDDVNRALGAHLTLKQRRILFRLVRLFEISAFRKDG